MQPRCFIRTSRREIYQNIMPFVQTWISHFSFSASRSLINFLSLCFGMYFLASASSRSIIQSFPLPAPLTSCFTFSKNSVALNRGGVHSDSERGIYARYHFTSSMAFSAAATASSEAIFASSALFASASATSRAATAFAVTFAAFLVALSHFFTTAACVIFAL